MTTQVPLNMLAQNPTNRNRIINGAMVIDQRNAGASVSVQGGEYIVDRWATNASQTSKFTAQQNAGSVTPPIGFTNYLGLTSSTVTSLGAGDIFNTAQYIEGFNSADLGWGTANAKTVTLSFQVYSSLTGTFGGSLQNSASSYSYPFSYSIPVANTWTTISVTITGPTAGTWIGATNGIGVRVYFSIGTGTTKSGTAGSWSASDYRSATGATSVVGTSGATFYITGVQLEVGSSATGYEYRQYGAEFALCQRYFEKIGGTASGDLYFGAGAVGAGYDSFTAVGFNTTKRTTPTVAKVGTWNVVNCSQPFTQSTNPNCMVVGTSSTAGSGQVYTYTSGTSTYLTASAEL